MATVQELEQQLRQAKAKGRTNKVAALQAQIRTMKQGQKAARVESPKLATATGATVKDLQKKLVNAQASGDKAKAAKIQSNIQTLKQGQKAARVEGGVQPPATFDGVAQVGLDGANTAFKGANTFISGMPTTYDRTEIDKSMPVPDEAFYKSTFDAAYNAATHGLDDQEAKRRQQELQYLADTGNPMGSDNYKTRLSDMDKEYEGFRSQARNNAFLTAGQEAERRFGIDSAGYGLKNAAFESAFSRPVEIASGLGQVGAGLYGVGQTDREFDEDVRRFGKTIALERQKIRAASANRGGGGGGGVDTSPILGGQAPGFNLG